MRAPCILSADDLGDLSGSYILEAADFFGAYYGKAMTPKRYGLYFLPKRAQSKSAKEHTRAQKSAKESFRVKMANNQVWELPMWSAEKHGFDQRVNSCACCQFF